MDSREVLFPGWVGAGSVEICGVISPGGIVAVGGVMYRSPLKPTFDRHFRPSGPDRFLLSRSSLDFSVSKTELPIRIRASSACLGSSCACFESVLACESSSTCLGSSFACTNKVLGCHLEVCSAFMEAFSFSRKSTLA